MERGLPGWITRGKRYYSSTCVHSLLGPRAHVHIQEESGRPHASERLAHVAITWGIPVACIDTFSLLRNPHLFAAILIVAGSGAGVLAYALLEHAFYRMMRKS